MVSCKELGVRKKFPFSFRLCEIKAMVLLDKNEIPWPSVALEERLIAIFIHNPQQISDRHSMLFYV